jgi:hypothetical protein
VMTCLQSLALDVTHRQKQTTLKQSCLCALRTRAAAMIGDTKLLDRGATTIRRQINFRPGIRALVYAALVVDPSTAMAAA